MVVEVLAEEGRQMITAKDICLTGKWVSPGFDALTRSRGKNKTPNYTVFNSLGAIFRCLTYIHLLLKLTPKVNTISSIPFLQMSKQRHRQGE